MNNHKAGLALGALLGIFHLSWSVLVAAGAAQAILNWIYKIHFLNNPFTVTPFDLGTAATLVLFTAIMGYILGWLLSLLWNALHKA